MSEDKDLQKKEEKGKIQKQFNLNLGKLTALLNGKATFRVPKADQPTLETAIAELAKEEKEELVKSIKEEAKKLIKEKRDFDKFVSEQRREFEKKVEQKQKEFNEKCKALWGKVENVKTLEESYYKTLKAANEGKPTDQPDDENSSEEEGQEE